MYTSHGQHIPNTDRDPIPPVAENCGGFNCCSVCLSEQEIFTPKVVSNASTSREV